MDRNKQSFASPLSLGILAAMIAVFAVCSYIAGGLVDFGDSAASVNFFLSIVTMMFTILLYIFCINSVSWDKKQKRLFSVFITTYFLCNIPLLLCSGVETNAGLWRVTRLLYTLLYLLSSLHWGVFWIFLKRNYRHIINEKIIEAVYWFFFGVFCIITVINHFTGFCFTVLPDGSFVIRSQLMFCMSLASFVLYMIVALLTVCTPKIKIVLFSYSFFPLIVWLPVFLFPYSQFYTDIFSSVAIFADLISLYLLFFNVYLESGRQFIQREMELEESRTKAMMLRISPHFISNTMSSVVALCSVDAEKAGELASKFACCLRDNYTDMTDEPMIPFSKELEHIRNYLAVEQIRFAGLKIEYNIKADRFLLPTLTVQPLAENAVRHGISKRSDASGTVKISSFENDGNYVIRIEDDGVGYKPPRADDGKKHIGIENAKTRLALLCNGTLTVERRKQGGTVCEIIIPKGEKK